VEVAGVTERRDQLRDAINRLLDELRASRAPPVQIP
jgi:hypothetical protein